jgi:uracil-DNA glycosylase family 4
VPVACPSAPEINCARCTRLAAFRTTNRKAHADWFNAPVPSFGSAQARLLIIGLAPGLKGANRTGRPFTGDFAGALLYDTLAAFGFSEGRFDARADDGLTLIDCRITNGVRCVPPANRPLPAEIAACRPFLQAEITAMPRLAIILALGDIAHRAVLAALGRKGGSLRFGHGARHALGPRLQLFDSYHCSRLNTNTGRLTPAMFRAVFAAIRAALDQAGD